MTPKESRRIAELLTQLSAVGIAATLRLIKKEMPHLTAAHIAEVARVRAEELRLDAAVQFAEVDASRKMMDIIEEAAHISGQPVARNAEALQILVSKAEQGNKRAAELLEEYRHAASVVGLDD